MYVYIINLIVMLCMCRCASIGGSDVPIHPDAAVQEGEPQGLAGQDNPQPTIGNRLPILPTGNVACVHTSCICIDDSVVFLCMMSFFMVKP